MGFPELLRPLWALLIFLAIFSPSAWVHKCSHSDAQTLSKMVGWVIHLRSFYIDRVMSTRWPTVAHSRRRILPMKAKFQKTLPIVMYYSFSQLTLSHMIYL